ncbi:monooxygenase [Pseudonocardia sulfidoxydans NBRC 16205]|uniref:Monooxygenase n=1 Tax=Pseudonocardia sulfidoxydans NBRC 16205 TaxID=1223511 RepID=A0A511DPG2_9PSEU|nr:FAD-dependent monooxygenase [Pseudonocardia sulfidoxydans]GEL26702.1 monooxygenase [Pseudonocardia sulfidoxydans NBRC 16205]
MHEKDILISGASIAGPALAFWLCRAGYRVTIVECAPALRPGGQTVDLRGAGRTVVDRMGLLDAVRERRVHERGLAYVDERGRRVAEMSAEAFGGEGIVAEIEILRGDLAEVLYDATRSDVEYLFGDRIVGLDEDGDGVDVRFASGLRRRFALVVGADGLHSGVRALAFGPESEYVRPLNMAMAFFTVPDRAVSDSVAGGWCTVHHVPGAVAELRPDRVAGQAKALLATHTTEPVHRLPRDRAQSLLRDALVDAGWRTPEILDAMDGADDFYVEGIGQVHMDSWARGRVVLLGDAAACPSPLTGMGTTLALVGAYVLAGELVSRVDPVAAFAAYERVVRPYAVRMRKLPPGGTRGFAPTSCAWIAMGRASMRWMTRWPLRLLAARIFAAADGIDLPAYDGLRSAAQLR